MFKTNCKICSKVIVKEYISQIKNWNSATCSKKCMGLFRSKFKTGKNGANWQGGNIKKKCLTCKKSFDISKSMAKKWINCSKKCHGKWRSNTFVGSNHPMWNGGRIITTRGYVMVLARSHPKANSKGYYSEHRIVMENHLGRLLDKSEVVHHINHDRTDNRIENLQHFKSHSDHIQTHHKKHLKTS